MDARCAQPPAGAMRFREGTFLPPAPGRRAAGALVVSALLGTIALGLLSTGTHHDDDLAHHLQARWSWRDPRYLLDRWGRPGFTVPYAPLAGLGLFGSRLTSALLSAGCAWLVYGIARRLGLSRPYLAPFLLYLQPLFTRLSYTSLTETPLAFYLALAVWLWLGGRRVFSAVVVSVGAITRYEAGVLLVVWAVWLAWRREWWGIPLLAWAPLLYNLLALSLLGFLPFRELLQPTEGVCFGRGTVLHYIFRLQAVSGVGLAPVALVGLAALLRRGGRGGGLVVAVALVYLVVETVIFAFGAYSSGGYARFLVPICPLLAVSACAAVDWLLEVRGAVRSAGVAAVLVGLLFLASTGAELRRGDPDALHYYRLLFPWSQRVGIGVMVVGLIATTGGMLARGRTGETEEWARRLLLSTVVVLLLGTLMHMVGLNRPYRLRPLERGIRRAVEFLRGRYPDRPTLSCTPWFWYFSGGFCPWGRMRMRRELEDAPRGSIFVWESRLAPSGFHRISLSWLLARGWREVWVLHLAEAPHRRASVRVFEKGDTPGDADDGDGSRGD